MREIFVAGAESGIGDDLAGGIVHRAALTAGNSSSERGILRGTHDFKGALKFFRGLAEDAHARDVRLIAFDGGAVINHHAEAFAKCLFIARAVGKRG